MIILAGLLTHSTFFLLGYIIAKLDAIKVILDSSQNDKPQSFLSQTKETRSKKKSKIDESTFVTDVSTDALQKSYDEIGKTTVTQDKVDASVSKLSQLKGKKG